MNEDIDIGDYCFDESEVTTRRPKPKHRIKHKGRFLCIPESWAIRAFEIARKKQTPGPVIVGLILWQEFWFQYGEQPLKFTNPMLKKFGLGRPFFSKWLFVLEKAGLLITKKFNNRSPLITLLSLADEKRVSNTDARIAKMLQGD
jgi:hypothetical protein